MGLPKRRYLSTKLHGVSSQRTVVLIAANSKLFDRSAENGFTFCTYCKVKRNADSLNTPAVIPQCITAVTRKITYKFLTRKTDSVSTLQSVHSGSNFRPASPSIVTGESYPREIKQLVCEADHSPQSSAEVNNGWS